MEELDDYPVGNLASGRAPSSEEDGPDEFSSDAGLVGSGLDGRPLLELRRLTPLVLFLDLALSALVE